jgi:hypothetical protein
VQGKDIWSRVYDGHAVSLGCIDRMAQGGTEYITECIGDFQGHLRGSELFHLRSLVGDDMAESLLFVLSTSASWVLVTIKSRTWLAPIWY